MLKHSVTIDPVEYPELKQYFGQKLITADGTTLLGADDKAGIAELITAMEYLISNPEIPHGKIRICITPDEEITTGVDQFDVSKFGAAFGYTIDGGEIGEIKYENFNGALATVNITGKSFHTGYAKNHLVNASLVGNEFISLLPPAERPENTENYEGFYHLLYFNGDISKAKLEFWVRDFDLNSFEQRKNKVKDIAGKLNLKYGDSTVNIEIKDQYYNMAEKIKPVMYIVDLAKNAMLEVGVSPKVRPIRGGSDGSRLTFKGLPCPNIFVGGHNYHGPQEYIPASSMEKAVEVIVKICELGVNIKT